MVGGVKVKKADDETMAILQEKVEKGELPPIYGIPDAVEAMIEYDEKVKQQKEWVEKYPLIKTGKVPIENFNFEFLPELSEKAKEYGFTILLIQLVAELDITNENIVEYCDLWKEIRTQSGRFLIENSYLNFKESHLGKSIVFVSSGEDLVRMKEQFGDAAGYYCSENNPKYGKQFDALENCIRDRKLQKRFVFTTKAIGMGIEIKDRTVKHIFIDQWKPTDIAQSMGRKRPLDAEDTCTVYFRDYDADWYMGDLKKFQSVIEDDLKPVEAFLAGEEAFAEYRQSGTPDKINRSLEKCRVMEWDASQGAYRVNQLGVKQLRYEESLLAEMIATSYKQAFVKYAVVDLKQDIRAYHMPVLMNWLKEHINQPMLKEDMYTGIMRTGVFMEYKGRAIGVNTLNEKLRSYGVQIISVSIGKHKAGNSVRWKLIEI